MKNLSPGVVHHSPSGDVNFSLPRELTLDTDSALNMSQQKLRDQLAGTQTTRHIKNRTIDIGLNKTSIEVGGGYTARKSKMPSERAFDEMNSSVG